MVPRRQYNSTELLTLTELSRELDSAVVPYGINETFIADYHEELTRSADHESEYFWLLYARMVEATLLCAGNYADNCEYSAVGDLLVNPRKIYVEDKASGKITLKSRHDSLSHQFKPDDMPYDQYKKSCSSSMELHVSEKPLLSMMADTMAHSGVFCESYLHDLHDRMEKVAATVVFLLVWSIRNRLELHHRLLAETPESQHFIKSNLCNFNHTVFERLGNELFRLERRHSVASNYLKPNPSIPDSSTLSM